MNSLLKTLSIIILAGACAVIFSACTHYSAAAGDSQTVVLNKTTVYPFWIYTEEILECKLISEDRELRCRSVEVVELSSRNNQNNNEIQSQNNDNEYTGDVSDYWDKKRS